MNFVDKFDQMKKTYEIDRKSTEFLCVCIEWCYRIFFYFLDAATVNAFIIVKELMSYRKGLKAFHLEIVDGSVATTYTKKCKSSGSAGPSVKVSKHKPHTPVEVRKCKSAHQPRLVMYRYLSIDIGGISLFLWYRLVVSISANIANTCQYFLSTK